MLVSDFHRREFEDRKRTLLLLAEGWVVITFLLFGSLSYFDLEEGSRHLLTLLSLLCFFGGLPVLLWVSNDNGDKRDAAILWDKKKRTRKLFFGWLVTGIILTWFNLRAPRVPNLDAVSLRLVSAQFARTDFRTRAIFNFFMIGRFAVMELAMFLGYGGSRGALSSIRLSERTTSNTPFPPASLAIDPRSRVTLYKRRYQLIKALMWITLISPVLMAVCVSRIDPDNGPPNMVPFWGALALFLISGGFTLYFSEQWGCCMACQSRFRTRIWTMQNPIKNYFPEYCPECKAPVMAQDPSHPALVKEKIIWFAEIRNRYRTSTRRLKRIQLTASLLGGLYALGYVALRLTTDNASSSTTFLTRGMWSLIIVLLLGIVASWAYSQTLEQINRCPHCGRRLSESAVVNTAAPEYKRCRFCQANVDSLFSS